MEYISGCKVNDLASLEAMNIDRAELSRSLSEIFSEMIFRHGFFHGTKLQET